MQRTSLYRPHDEFESCLKEARTGLRRGNDEEHIYGAWNHMHCTDYIKIMPLSKGWVLIRSLWANKCQFTSLRIQAAQKPSQKTLTSSLAGVDLSNEREPKREYHLSMSPFAIIYTINPPNMTYKSLLCIVFCSNMLQML